jgi:hypothetical protein
MRYQLRARRGHRPARSRTRQETAEERWRLERDRETDIDRCDPQGQRDPPRERFEQASVNRRSTLPGSYERPGRDRITLSDEDAPLQSVRMGSVTRFASVLALTATLAVVAAGCGGGASPEEKWADSVCTDIGDWKSQIQKSVSDVREQLQSPGTGTIAAIDAEIQEAVDATNQLASDLKALGAPDTESGAQAKQQVDALATQLDSTVTKTKQTVESLPDGASVSQVTQTLAPLLPSLQSLAVKVSSTLSSVQESGSELKDGFEKADSCEQFR